MGFHGFLETFDSVMFLCLRSLLYGQVVGRIGFQDFSSVASGPARDWLREALFG